MTKFERREYFERLCQLRAEYSTRGEYDSASVLPIRDAVRYAGTLFEQSDACDEKSATGANQDRAPGS